MADTINNTPERVGTVDMKKAPDVIYGHKVTQTKRAKFLLIENLYQRFHRPNFYDIGGTYIEDIADFWFLYNIEQVGEIFMMHLFINKRQEVSFAVSVSYSGTIRLDKKSNLAYLPSTMKLFQFRDPQGPAQNYILTYTFSNADVNCLKNKSLLIPISFSAPDEDHVNYDIYKRIKARHDFGQLLTDSTYSDFTIESSEGQQFKVHKLILASHSDVFKAMFRENTAESQSGYVKLIDVGTEDLQHTLEFIYTGSIKNLDNANFINLLTIADEYNLSGLKDLSHYVLKQNLSLENVVDTLVVADMYGDVVLKLDTLKFIKKYPAALEENSFKELNNAALIREVCLFIAS